jgi:hypothetical protein
VDVFFLNKTFFNHVYGVPVQPVPFFNGPGKKQTATSVSHHTLLWEDDAVKFWATTNNKKSFYYIDRVIVNWSVEMTALGEDRLKIPQKGVRFLGLFYNVMLLCVSM